MGIQYPVMMFTPDVIRNYDNFQSIPTTFIIDKKGRIVNKITGYRPRTFWEEEIKKIL
jgi:thioredoxin-related protein